MFRREKKAKKVKSVRKKRKNDADSPNNNKRQKTSDTETDSSGPPDLEPFVPKENTKSTLLKETPISISSEDEMDEIFNDLNSSLNSKKSPKKEKSPKTSQAATESASAKESDSKKAKNLDDMKDEEVLELISDWAIEAEV